MVNAPRSSNPIPLFSYAPDAFSFTELEPEPEGIGHD